MNAAELATYLQGIHILPGQWRPLFPCEQIAWLTPPWLSNDYPWPYKDYLWLDFPEAIFAEGKCYFLSHGNPGCPPIFPNLPRVPWKQVCGGIAFDRTLPNGVIFGGSVTCSKEMIVRLELFIRNGSRDTLRGIGLQTCAFLRGAGEFDAHTNDNKFVRVPKEGWVPVGRAYQMSDGTGRWKLGFRGTGPAVADLPVIVAQSSHAERFVAMTWGESTASLVTNPRHPCIHAEPTFPELAPGEEARVRGALYFGEGSFSNLDEQAIESWLH